jgi:hypothetical protein
MFAFYFCERIIGGKAEREIWSESYFELSWQFFFDVFNSLPLIALGAVLAWKARASVWLAFFASMALHCLADLPLHREDAHAHFFPLSSWRFQSPVSYWDPAHYGLFFAGAETLLVIAGALVLSRYCPPHAWRILGGASLLVYLALGAFALSMWAT